MASLFTRRPLRRLGALALAAAVLAGCMSTKPAPKQGDQPAAKPAPQQGASQGRYKEAPMLAKLVQEGKLPPVDQRLPKDPLVVQPAERIGQYGGTWRTTLRGRADNPWFYRTVNGESFLIWTPDWKGIQPDIMASYKVEDGGRSFVFTLREGMKWSDGHPVTADDVLFWYEDVLLNKELTPVIPSWLQPGRQPVKVTKVDDRTVRFTFAVPHGLFLQNLATPGGYLIRPSHYLKQFHKKYNPQKVEEEIKKRQVQDWVALWNQVTSPWENPELPTLNPWVVKVPLGKGTQVVFERNPYYWKVDPEGNQLPYLDQVVYEIHEDVNTMVLKALNGEIDMQDRHIATNANKAVFAENMQKGNYRFFEVKRAESNPIVIALNLTHKDPVLRQIFQDKRFRIALSHAINRKEIIDTVFVGQGEPWQVAPLPETPFYNEKLAKQYTEYDPAKANQLLDEMGLNKKDARGIRLRPDGKPLTINLEISSSAPAEGWPETGELIKKYWGAVGVDVNVKVIDRSLFYERKRANEHDANIWTGDGGAFDAMLQLRWYFPFNDESNFAIPWALWFQSYGQTGEEPPAAAKKQMELYRQLEQTVDEAKQVELMKEILRIAQEEFWVMGIVKWPPAYGIVRNDFHNVPKSMWGSASFNNPFPTQTFTYFTTRQGK